MGVISLRGTVVTMSVARWAYAPLNPLSVRRQHPVVAQPLPVVLGDLLILALTLTIWTTSMMLNSLLLSAVLPAGLR